MRRSACDGTASTADVVFSHYRPSHPPCTGCGSVDADEYGCPHCGPRHAGNNGWCAICGQELWKARDSKLDAEYASDTHPMVCPGYEQTP